MYAAAAVKRSHDLGNSGWMVFLPIYNPFVLAFGDSQPFTNQYGPSPKGISMASNAGSTSQQVVVNNYLGNGESQKIIDNPPVSPLSNNPTATVLTEASISNLLTADADTILKGEKHNDSEKISGLRQLKELLDSGILTQEEFDQQKNKILSN
ncbi:MAG: hypothetical protein BGN92_13530 [Sphingobacteriales bacterium 41-5]|nr:MAG: hypothetical protein BGN92_13530 [Sphingobacteriales bacterium 41-5]